MIQANEVMARANELYREKKGVEYSMPSEQIHALCIALCESFNKEIDKRIGSIIWSPNPNPIDMPHIVTFTSDQIKAMMNVLLGRD